MGDISEKTQAHLSRVYQTLFCGVGSCALGMYINMHMILQGFFFMLIFMIAMTYLVF
jgi:FtsH-binding integral membrane protein